MDSLYHKKYLKYREKYLALKNQIGGTVCERCGNELKNCTCPPYLDTLPNELISDVYTRLNLDGLISLSQTNKMFREEIKFNLNRILAQVIRNETPANIEIIQAFLDGTRTNLGMITIGNLIMFRGYLLEIGKFNNGSYNRYLPNVVASLVSQEMFNLFGLLLRVFKPYSPSSWNLLRSMEKINTVMSQMNPHKAVCLSQILEHCKRKGYQLQAFAFEIERIARYDDDQFSQLLKFTINDLMSLHMASFFMNYRLTDEELQQTVTYFRALGSYNNMDVEYYIRRLRGQ
jgi:hypothetical protein